jgi:hypothetical protein
MAGNGLPAEGIVGAGELAAGVLVTFTTIYCVGDGIGVFVDPGGGVGVIVGVAVGTGVPVAVGTGVLVDPGGGVGVRVGIGVLVDPGGGVSVAVGIGVLAGVLVGPVQDVVCFNNTTLKDDEGGTVWLKQVPFSGPVAQKNCEPAGAVVQIEYVPAFRLLNKNAPAAPW